MGGKHKQSQRTKNNARPSSSGRSAEMLGTSMPQFVGFSTVKEAGFVLPGFSLPGTETTDNSLDANFQLVLKKMNKKDATTKLKALQEFADLVKNSEAEAVKAVLAFWPRLYSALATDTEHRVREAAHLAHLEVALKVKRNLAPYLKQVIGPWFTAQYDSYPPAATAATQAFEAAFPTSKIQEVMIFCEKEILLYICDNLTNQSAETITNSKTVSTEEAEAKYERVLLASLQGYSLYLAKVPTEHIKKSEELNMQIISHHNFWKLSKHKTMAVQAAFFGVISAVGQKAPFLFETQKPLVVTTVFSNLDKSDPTVLPKIWECLLLITANIEQWWQYVSIEKVFITKLLKVLRQGGNGNAVAVYPHLLPLLSNLPTEVVDVNVFYVNFFESMKTGLKQKNVIASRSESLAITTSFIECLKYVILSNKSNIVLCEKLIRSQLISLIEWCLLDVQSCYKTVFNQVTSLIHYWNRNQNDIENCTVFYKQFWSNLESLFQGLLLNMEAKNEFHAICELAGRQVEMLQSLKHTVKPKKQFKVKFMSDTPQETDQPDGDRRLSDCGSVYFESLNNLVQKTCEMYVKLINDKRVKDLIEHLYCLINDFDSNSIFVFLLKQLGGGDEPSGLVNIYKAVLYKWLKCQYLCSKPVVDLVFLLFKCLNTQEKTEIFETLSDIKQDDCLGWCIAQALSYPHNEDPIVQKWLQSDKPSSFISKIVDMELADECPPELSVLLKLALSENNSGELLLSKKTVTEIIEKLQQPLLNPNEYPLTVDTCASLAAYVSTIVYSEKLCLLYGDDLLLALFTLSCNSHTDSETLSKDTLWEVSTSWQDVVMSVAPEINKEEFKTLVGKFAKIVEKEILSAGVLDVNVEHFVTVLVNFARCCQESVPLLTNDVLMVFLEQEFFRKSKSDAENLCIWAEYVTGKMSSLYNPLELPQDTNESELAKCFAMLHIKVQVLSSPLETEEEDDDEEESDTPRSKTPIILNVCDNNVDILCQMLYELALCESYIANYRMAKFVDIVQESCNKTKESVKKLIENLDTATKFNLKAILTEKLHTKSWLWARAIRLLYSEIVPESLTEIYDEFVNKRKETDTKLGVIHLTQVFSDSLCYENIPSGFDEIENVITLRSLLYGGDDLEVQIAENFSRIESIRNRNIREFLYDGIQIDWKGMQTVVEIIRYCTTLVEFNSKLLSRKHWDFGVISLVSWTENILKAKAQFEDAGCIAFLAAIANFFITVTKQIAVLKEEDPSSHFINEWEDLFAQNINLDMFHIWYILAEKYESQKQLSIHHLPFLSQFGRITDSLDSTHLFKSVEGGLKWTKFVKMCAALLVNSSCTLQLWGYKMLLIMTPGLVEVDSVGVKSNKPHEKGLVLEHLKELLMRTEIITETMLLEFKLGEDSCRVEPFTDSFTYTFAYLLLWDVLLNLCEKASTELRFQYSEWLQEEGMLKNLLKNIFRLMPAEVLHCSESKSKVFNHLFTVKPALDLCDVCTSETLEHLVCSVYSAAVSQLPALIRQWWTNTDTRVSQVVERVTSAYVSPQLCSRELADVAQHETKFKNMVVKVYPGVREVVAVYTVDEAQMELVITLPPNYPLGVPDVQCSRQIGGTSHRQWLMQLKMCILHQNGRIWDGLSLWNNNLDKKFDGVEECYICFAVLHPGTYQLPKLCCQTCKKKFHSACLYKWFSTSNKSTCPICRNLF